MTVRQPLVHSSHPVSPPLRGSGITLTSTRPRTRD